MDAVYRAVQQPLCEMDFIHRVPLHLYVNVQHDYRVHPKPGVRRCGVPPCANAAATSHVPQPLPADQTLQLLLLLSLWHPVSTIGMRTRSVRTFIACLIELLPRMPHCVQCNWPACMLPP